MGVFKRGRVWWYKFNWNGRPVRESTKQTNKRVAEQMEAAHRTSLAKGEVGIRERKPVPTLATFIDLDFLPFVRATSAAKPKTVSFYELCAENLKAFPKLAKLPLDKITSDVIGAYVATRQEAGMQVATVNRELATLRRMFYLAQEWGRVSTVLPRVRMLPGENHRERVLSHEEESAYLAAASSIGRNREEAYQRALAGVRATLRGETPQKPDAYLLRDVVTVLIDCGLRPEECFRLSWTESIWLQEDSQGNLVPSAIEIHKGKGRGSRRRVPLTPRLRAILEMRRIEAGTDWVFPAPTKSGHIEPSTLKKQHAEAVEASRVRSFVLYTLRHTCITRWAKHMDPFTLHVLAGHTDMNTTKRYVHPSEADILEAMEKARGGHNSGHSALSGTSEALASTSAVN